MSNRTMTYLIGLVVILACVLMLLNLFNIKTDPVQQRFIEANNVKAVEVVSKDVPHPLTFEQQKLFITIINGAAAVGFEGDLNIKQPVFPYEKVIIHQVEGDKITVTPYGMVNTQLLMDIPEWNTKGLIREMGPGRLNKLFSDAVSK